MANVIRIKRRLTGNAGAPSSLYGGELAYNEVDGTLFYGKGDDGSGTATSVIAIGGSGLGGEYVTLSTTQTITGNKTWSGQNFYTGEVDFSGAAISGISLFELDDVDINPETPPNEGDVLTWDDDSQRWIPLSIPRDSITSIEAAPGTGISVTTLNGVATISGIDATNTVKGVVRFANTLELTEMTASNVVVSPADLAAYVSQEITANEYVLPVATDSVLGGIKVGDRLAITADGVLSVDMPGALQYKGSADVTAAAPAAEVGDVYICENAGGAVADASWTGIGGDTISENALLLWDGSEWDTADLNVDTGVVSLSGVAPIQVNNANPKAPVISVDDATTDAKGVVELATAQELVDGATGVVPTADQVAALFNSVNDRLPDGANEGENLSWNSQIQQWVSGWLDGGIF